MAEKSTELDVARVASPMQRRAPELILDYLGNSSVVHEELGDRRGERIAVTHTVQGSHACGIPGVHVTSLGNQELDQVLCTALTRKNESGAARICIGIVQGVLR